LDFAHSSGGNPLPRGTPIEPSSEIRPVVGIVNLIESAATQVAFICRYDGKLESGHVGLTHGVHPRPLIKAPRPSGVTPC